MTKIVYYICDYCGYEGDPYKFSARSDEYGTAFTVIDGSHVCRLCEQTAREELVRVLDERAAKSAGVA